MPHRRGLRLSDSHRAAIDRWAQAREDNRRNQLRERNRNNFMRSLSGQTAPQRQEAREREPQQPQRQQQQKQIK